MMGAVTPETCREVLQWINICILLHFFYFYSHNNNNNNNNNTYSRQCNSSDAWLTTTRVWTVDKAENSTEYNTIYIEAANGRRKIGCITKGDPACRQINRRVAGAAERSKCLQLYCSKTKLECCSRFWTVAHVNATGTITWRQSEHRHVNVANGSASE